MHCPRWISIGVLLFWGGAVTAGRAQPVDFARDIRPLLSDRCFVCHGPDAGQREADLRLDLADAAYEYAIQPGRPDASPFVQRIFSADPDERMPPAASNLSLSDAEKALLRRWVEQGAVYDAHWAFVAPMRPEVPQIDFAPLQSDNPIDAFVWDRFKQQGLRPAPVADRGTLIRRLSLDLIGLPPSPEEVDAFLRDDRPGAYERLVDRLLASPRFGERMALDWLDVARYADTYGYQNDRYRAMWPWRDWVVEAFNANLPYDQFITWQIAGDLLPNATRRQILATAFNRNHRQTNEGGSVEEEFRAEYVADRVNTFGAAFLGLTLECARCHDHKYDPISQREYYQLAAFFNSIDESGLYSHFTEATPTPTLLLPTSEQAVELAELESEFDRAREAVRRSSVDPTAYRLWRNGLIDRPSLPWPEMPPVPEVSLQASLENALNASQIGYFPFDRVENNHFENRAGDRRSAQGVDDPQVVPGKVGQGLQLSGDNGVSMSAGGEFTRNDPFTIALWIHAPAEYDRAVVFHRSRAWTDSGSRGYELLIEQGRLSAALIHFWPGNAVRVVAREKLPLDRWVHVAVVYDGSWQAEGLELYVDGRRIETDTVRDKLTKHIIGSDGFPGGDVRELAIGNRFRDKGFKQGRVDELRIFDRDLTPLEIAYVHARDAVPDRGAAVLQEVPEQVLERHHRMRSPETRKRASVMQQAGRRLAEFRDPIPEIMVMEEMQTPRPTFVLIRGAYDKVGEPVERRMPEHIFASYKPPSKPVLSRLDLAEWLCHPRHPLTARVAVNRIWQLLFGRGLVSTSEDFGMQGNPPSHPELLDWLAVEFVESGWNVKALIKRIVMSHTYRQSSDLSPRLRESDPENVLLARGPSVRLPAELLRDAALRASGLLVEKQGGPPVKPFQPDGLWREKSGQAYQRDPGEGSHRRSLYTFWKRTSPPPSMMAFDAGAREVCTVRRQVTMTPMQTLVLWNDPQFVEAAVALAEDAVRRHHDLDAQLEYIFRWLTSRRPDDRELQVLRRMYGDQIEGLAGRGEAAASIPWLQVGDHRIAENVNPRQVAGLAMVANGLMNYDETVMKR